MMINPLTTRVIIQSKDGRCESALLFWLMRLFPQGNVLVAEMDCRLEVARNRVIHDFLKGPQSYEHLVMFDDDMRPDDRALPLFNEEADLVGCSYETPTPNAWLRPDDIHCGAMRISRFALTKMTPPWFAFKYSETGLQCLECECNAIRDQAVRLGLSVKRAGYCRNQNRRSWCGH